MTTPDALIPAPVPGSSAKSRRVFSGPPLLQVEDLKVYFTGPKGEPLKAVDGISFAIHKGETLGLVGESGCGKSLTALTLMRLNPTPASTIAGGRILFEGEDLLQLPEAKMRALRGSRISMIFQEPATSLNPVQTVGRQIAEVLELHRGLRGSALRKETVALLDQVRIPDPDRRCDEYPHQMSGGMKQRVMIAMALACKPQLLIADEPTTAVDVTIQAQILELIDDLRKELDMALLLITHSVGLVNEVADRVAVMYAGKVAEYAPVQDLLANPRHPYTKGLMECLPSGQTRGMALNTIPGHVPRPRDFPVGCRFSGRCPQEMPGCRGTLPRILNVQPEHQVACHLYDDTFKQEPSIASAHALETLRPPDTSRDTEALLSIRGLKVYFPIKRGILQRTVGHVRAVDGVDLELKKGRSIALVGESGCGKTTAGKSIIQLLKPTEGAIEYQGQDLCHLGSGGMLKFRRDLQIIFQDPNSSLNPRMTIGDILTEGMRAHQMYATHAEELDHARELLKTVQLPPDRLNAYPHEFSGGQKQRIGIARALSVNPAFIVCDEVTSALDVSVQAGILNLLVKLQQEKNLTFLFITHDLHVVHHVATDVAVMYLGRIVEYGTVDEVFNHPKHPYTRALLDAVPEVDPELAGRKRIRLEGDVPSPAAPPSGCHFHTRCPKRFAPCDGQYPGVSNFSSTHFCKCYLYDAEGKPAANAPREV
ncbi:MAG TPA: ABC transporter ATP-binding protein [Planctomycetota bacterium]|nr:ABC transporter ATP-binding protein [Planctomycetota bacterium]